SPDGHWMAYRSTRGGTSDLYVRSAEPEHATRRLTSLVGPASGPDWRREGRGLLFTAQAAVTFKTWWLRFDRGTLASRPESGAGAAHGGGGGARAALPQAARPRPDPERDRREPVVQQYDGLRPGRGERPARRRAMGAYPRERLAVLR